MHSIKYCKAYMKKYGVKGTSKYNKQQLNTKMLDVSNEKYKTRKTIKQDTTASLVFQLTKNETITNHIMSYLVNTTYYDYIKNTVHFECLHELQLFELASYGTHTTIGIHVPIFRVTKEEMFSTHTYLINHPITRQIIVSYYIRNSLESKKEYLLYGNNNYSPIYKTKLTETIFWFNKKCGEKIAYSYN